MMIKTKMALLKSSLIASSLILGGFTVSAQTVEEGKKAYEQDLYDKAGTIFKASLAKSPSAETWFYLGNVYYNTEKKDSAYYSYNEGLKLNAAEALNYVGVGRIKLAEGNKAEARTNFDKALELTKNKNYDVMNEIAVAIFEVFDKTEVGFGRALIDKAMAKKKTNENYIITSGDLYRLEGESGKGITEYKRAVQVNARSTKANLRIADLYLKQGNFEAAEPFYTDVKQIDANYAPLYIKLSDYYRETGKYQESITNFEKYLTLAGNSEYNLYNYGSLLYQVNEFAKAEVQFQKVVNLNSKNVFALRLLAYSQKELGKFQEASQNMDRFFSLVKPKDIISKDYVTRGEARLGLGNFTGAVEDLKKYNDNDTAHTYEDKLIVALDSAKDYGMAADVLNARVERKKASHTLNNDDYYTYYNLGKYQNLAKRYNEADAAFAKSIELKPDLISSYYQRILIHENNDKDFKTGEATPYYEAFMTATAAEKDKYKGLYVKGYTYMGYVAYNKKDFATSKQNFLKVKELDPNNKSATQMIDYFTSVEKQKKKK
ncbi:MAG: hypothetical protein SGJ04_03150 [Bacteroidota bacterium]|nr:hypothetical protein [Bacteroidota bacterium]